MFGAQGVLSEIVPPGMQGAVAGFAVAQYLIGRVRLQHRGQLSVKLNDSCLLFIWLETTTGECPMGLGPGI